MSVAFDSNVFACAEGTRSSKCYLSRVWKALPFIGALGAWLTLRAGGSTRH